MIPCAGTRNDLPLPFARCQERDIAAAVEYQIRQRDARLGPCAGNGKGPTPVLFERRLAWKQGSGVSVLSDAEQRHVEDWTIGVELVRALVALQYRFVGRGSLLRR